MGEGHLRKMDLADLRVKMAQLETPAYIASVKSIMFSAWGQKKRRSPRRSDRLAPKWCEENGAAADN